MYRYLIKRINRSNMIEEGETIFLILAKVADAVENRLSWVDKWRAPAAVGTPSRRDAPSAPAGSWR